MTAYRYRCRICGQRLVYLRRTYTFRHILPGADHAPLPDAEKALLVAAYERRLDRTEHDS